MVLNLGAARQIWLLRLRQAATGGVLAAAGMIGGIISALV
jgi:acetyl-CoA carboxylase beta subunit